MRRGPTLLGQKRRCSCNNLSCFSTVTSAKLHYSGGTFAKLHCSKGTSNTTTNRWLSRAIFEPHQTVGRDKLSAIITCANLLTGTSSNSSSSSCYTSSTISSSLIRACTSGTISSREL